MYARTPMAATAATPLPGISVGAAMSFESVVVVACWLVARALLLAVVLVEAWAVVLDWASLLETAFLGGGILPHLF